MDEGKPAILTIEEWQEVEIGLPYTARVLIRVLRVRNNQPIDLKQFKGFEVNLEGINIFLHELGKPYRLSIHRGEHNIDCYLVRL